MRRVRGRSAWRRVVTLVALLLAALVLAPTSLGGSATYLTTRGVSMTPRFDSGDLAILRSAGDAQVGDIAAYRSAVLGAVVMHRVVGVEAGRYTFKGDNNAWLDPDRPTSADVLGTLVLRVPQGSVWLERVARPSVIALVAVALLAGGGAAHARSRARRRTMARHATTRARRRVHPLLHAAPAWTRTAAAGTVAAAVLGLALAAVAWTAPVTASTTVREPTGRAMEFSYSALVAPSAAYDGTTVTSPDPVFRALADSADVHLRYEGPPGALSVTAELSTSSGWRSTVALAQPATLSGERATTTVRLDLPALLERARAGARASGMPADQLLVDVVVTVRTPGLPSFMPAMHLSLSDLQLRLAQGPAALTVTDAATLDRVLVRPGALAFWGRTMPVTTARVVALAMVLAAVLSAAVILLRLRRAAPTDEATSIRNRYASLVVLVEPVVTPGSRPVVDVTDVATLARIAERHGLLVLHWTRSGIGTFVVQDEGSTYRYRTTSAVAPRPPGGQLPAGKFAATVRGV